MILSHLIHALRAWRLYRRGVRELSKLSDLELTDIGLARSDIHSAAWHSAQDCVASMKSDKGTGVGLNRKT
jgi:uncharacterized protein YjiS (DUF1127 family)